MNTLKNIIVFSCPILKRFLCHAIKKKMLEFDNKNSLITSNNTRITTKIHISTEILAKIYNGVVITNNKIAMPQELSLTNLNSDNSYTLFLGL